MSQHILSPLKRSIVGVQFMFVVFGSMVLVSLPVGFDPAIALLAAGLGLASIVGVILNLVIPDKTETEETAEANS